MITTSKSSIDFLQRRGNNVRPTTACASPAQARKVSRLRIILEPRNPSRVVGAFHISAAGAALGAADGYQPTTTISFGVSGSSADVSTSPVAASRATIVLFAASVT